MLRWGLLGAAGITDRALAPALRAAGHDLAVVGARSLERARAFAERHGVRAAVGSYDEVLAGDVDAVYVALPNDLHEPWSVAALRAGKHVLCEKPLALDAAGAARVAAAADEGGRLAMEAVMTRFHPRTRALLDLVHGAIGELRAVAAGFTFTMDRPADYRAARAQGGGALLDVGIYGVAMSRWLAGAEPDRVQALSSWWPGGADASTTALLGFGSGAVASVAASFEAAPAQFLQVVGTAGTLSVPQPFTAREGAVILRDGEPLGQWDANPYVEMVRAFGEAVSAGAAQAPLPITDAVASAVVLDRIAAAVSAPTPRAAPPGGPTGPGA